MSDALANALRDLQPIDPTEALRRLQGLVQTEPSLRSIRDDYSHPPETLKWLGELDAVVTGMKRGDHFPLRAATDLLVRTQGASGAEQIRSVLYRALAAAEFAAPASEQGTFIAAGNELDAYAAITKVLASANDALLIVDPYMDGKALTDFMPGAKEGVMLRLLADEAWAKPTLVPAAEKWRTQFRESRPLNIRLAPPRSLHDRLIVVDAVAAWTLTQSLKDFAKRAHGSVLKVDPETARLKISAYADLWEAARLI